MGPYDKEAASSEAAAGREMTRRAPPCPLVVKHHLDLKCGECSANHHPWPGQHDDLVEHFLEDVHVHCERRFEYQSRHKDEEHQVRVEVRDGRVRLQVREAGKRSGVELQCACDALVRDAIVRDATSEQRSERVRAQRNALKITLLTST